MSYQACLVPPATHYVNPEEVLTRAVFWNMFLPDGS